MKILLVKTTAGYVDVRKSNTYNHQELGLAKALNKAGHQCDVVYYGGNNPHQIEIPYNDNGNTFTLYYVRAWNFMRNSMYIGLDDIAKKYDIVHSGGYDTIQSWLFAKKIPNKVVIYNGTYYSNFNRKYNKKCAVINKLFVPTYIKKNITFDTKNHLSEIFLREKGITDVTSIGVGIDLSIIENKAKEDNEFIDRIKALRKNGKKILLYIGRIEPRRNILFLLDIIKEVSKTKDISLVIIGKTTSQEYGNIVFGKMKEMKEHVEYCPLLDQKYLRAIYRLSDIFLLPTIYEIFGMVLLEAMYYKLPVITTLNGGSDLMIKSGENGYILKNNDVKLWSSTILNVLNNPEISQQIGEKSHNTIVNNFTWDALAVKFIALFERKLSANAKK